MSIKGALAEIPNSVNGYARLKCIPRNQLCSPFDRRTALTPDT